MNNQISVFMVHSYCFWHDRFFRIIHVQYSVIPLKNRILTPPQHMIAKAASLNSWGGREARIHRAHRDAGDSPAVRTSRVWQVHRDREISPWEDWQAGHAPLSSQATNSGLPHSVRSFVPCIPDRGLGTGLSWIEIDIWHLAITWVSLIWCVPHMPDRFGN